jgi:diguanylate cyclase (GGDEF)-like protein
VLLARAGRARRTGEGDGVAAPLRREGGVVGAMVVTDRSGDVATFDTEDLMVFETLANHASVALENGSLVDRLRDEAAVRHHQATHDALTGLPNRRLFGEVADRRLASGGAVVLIDLDRFKEVNDTLGHEVGDELLREVGARLAAAAPDGAVLAHLGGDEFAVLLGGPHDETDVLATGEALLAALRPPFTVGDLHLEVEATAGAVLCPEHGRDSSVLLRRAEVAMYAAKERHAGLEVYAPERDPHSPERLALVGDLRLAIDAGALELHYQPQADLVTGEVHGAEALVRWTHPERGFLSPAEFLPLAERTGLIRGLTLGVLAQAVHQAAAWHRAGRALTVSVNLSARNLTDPSLPGELAEMLRAAALPPALLVLEITESTVMGDLGRSLAVLHELRALGVQVAVDDFGTGHSSLSYLQDLPVDELKIDRSFVLARGTGAGDAIIATVVRLGHALGLRIVAEGIEDEPTWDRLRELGCDLAQGYLLSRPLPPAAFDAWLAARPTPAAAGVRS